ncbi:MAG TPA: DUF4019 domain-containing protein [Terriglobia bacterium]
MHNRRTRFTFCTGLVLGLAAAAGTYAQDTPQALAQKASEEWLALVDAGKYGESWDAAAQAFQKAVSRKDWESKVKAARAPLGKVVSRKLTKSDLMKNPPNAPPGEYVGLQYQSSFEHLKSAGETVVPILGQDGKWRVSHYNIRKGS